ncbi:MAG: hypothetical protein LBL47_05135 [Lactobacillus sp.]|jgi:hypothetical protein|nr:hypothetical protein [Lactobacillus sp.]
MKKNLFALSLIFGILFSLNLSAKSFEPLKEPQAPLSNAGVPSQLKGWEAWAVDGFDKNNCNFSFDNKGKKFCYFISSIAVDINGKEMSFTQNVSLKEKGYVLVPGSFEVFPYAVTVNGKSAPVANLMGLPYMLLDKGEYVIAGKAKAKEDVRHFSIPADAVILSVKKDGKEVANPTIDASGILRLETQSAVKKETDDVSYAVFRKIDDSIPMMMTMRIEVNVTGSQRIENVGNIIPKNFTVMSLSSSLPVHIQKNGDLIAEVSAGNWWIEVMFRQINETLDLSVDNSPAAQEIWVFAKDTSRRAIQVPQSLTQIQTKTTNLPNGWKQFPGYEVSKGDKISLSVVEYQDKQRDSLSLSRDAKLSFDGKSFFIRDVIGGTLKENGQMYLEKPFNLSSVEVNSTPQSIIITKNNQKGFEVRKGHTNIAATNQIKSSVKKIKAAGYDRDFENVNWSLNLSPGYKLFHVTGADSVSSSWVGNWNLLSIFMVVLLGVIFYYLFGLKKAIIAEAAFVLMQPVFAQFVVMSFVICGVICIERYIGKNNKIHGFINFIKYSMLLFLGLATLGFMIENLRYAIYPSLDQGYVFNVLMSLIDLKFLLSFYAAAAVLYLLYRIYANPQRATWKKVIYTILIFFGGLIGSGILSFLAYEGQFLMGAASRMVYDRVYAEPAMPAMVMESAMYEDDYASYDNKVMDVRRSKISAKSRSLSSKEVSQQMAVGYINNDAKLANYQSVNIAKNKVQTGIGFPEWRDRSVSISLKGPVSQNDAFGIYLMCPLVNLIIALAQLMLGAMILYYLMDRRKEKMNASSTKKEGKIAAKTLAVLFFGMLMIKPVNASEIPTNELLTELKTKLTREQSPACIPNCISMPNAVISMEGQDVVLDLLVHAQDDVVAPLPTLRADGGGYIKVKDISLNGASTKSVIKEDDVIKVLLNKGINNVRIKAAIGHDIERFSIASNVKISLMQNASSMFEVSENAGSAQIFQVKIKSQKNAEQGRTMPSSSKIDIIPFFQVSRKLDIGTIWQVTTTVRKMNSSADSASIEIPLLEGEKVISSEGTLLKDKIRISFEPNDMVKEFVSILPVEEKVFLKSDASTSNYREVWELNVDMAWSFDTKGIKPLNVNSNEAVFAPSQGDELEIDVYRSNSAEGEVITFDKVDYTLSYGRSIVSMDVNARARSSEGGSHEIILPKGAEVKDLKIDGQNYPVSMKDNSLVVPMNNGETIISFRAEMVKSDRNIWSFPKIDLKAPAVNIYQSLNVAKDRWVLFASGPSKGPAVLFWSQIPLWLLLAFVLAKSKLTEVKGWQWFILLTGLSQSRMLFSIIVVTWFVIMGVREKYSDKLKMKKLVQLIIPVLSLMFVYCLIKGISNGLLGTWDMKITGNGSFYQWRDGGMWVLKWYQDAVAGILPSPYVVSLPLWAYRTLMVLWSIWLAFSFVRWFKWGAKAYQKDGMWK